MVREFIIKFGDAGISKAPAFDYGAIGRAADNKCATIFFKDDSADIQSELFRLQKVAVKAQLPIHYVGLNEETLKSLPEILTDAALSGHWVLLEDLHNIPRHINELQNFLVQFFSYREEKDIREKKLADRKKQLEEEEELDDPNQAMRDELERIACADFDTKHEGAISLKMPDIDDFFVEKSFRLWISVNHDIKLPLSLL